MRRRVDVLSGFAIDFGNGRSSQSVSREDRSEGRKLYLTREDRSGSGKSRNCPGSSEKIPSVPEVQKSLTPFQRENKQVLRLWLQEAQAQVSRVTHYPPARNDSQRATICAGNRATISLPAIGQTQAKQPLAIRMLTPA